MALGAGELATGIAVAIKHDVTYPGAAVPLLALSDLILLQSFDAAIDLQLARRQLYVPQDTLLERALAPFNPRVLAKPEVALGIVGTFAAGLAVTAATDGLSPPFRGKPILFGKQFQQGLGYATGTAIGVGLFEHVALAEETTFRGFFQSSFARRSGEDLGWIYGSLLFGAMHAPNALFMDSSQRLSYLTIGVPFITVLGSYLGLAYRWNGYSLAPPVAIHFWYDLLISAASFVMDPRNNQLSGSIAIPF
jgi:membrane protease YdiL (CAAX protease family)